MYQDASIDSLVDWGYPKSAGVLRLRTFQTLKGAF